MPDSTENSTLLAVNQVELKYLNKSQSELSDRFKLVEQSTPDPKRRSKREVIIQKSKERVEKLFSNTLFLIINSI